LIGGEKGGRGFATAGDDAETKALRRGLEESFTAGGHGHGERACETPHELRVLTCADDDWCWVEVRSSVALISALPGMQRSLQTSQSTCASMMAGPFLTVGATVNVRG